MSRSSAVLVLSLFGVSLACGAADARPGIPEAPPSGGGFAFVPVGAPGVAVVPVNTSRLPAVQVDGSCFGSRFEEAQNLGGLGTRGQGMGGGGFGSIGLRSPARGMGAGGSVASAPTPTAPSAAPPAVAQPRRDAAKPAAEALRSSGYVDDGSTADATAATGLLGGNVVPEAGERAADEERSRAWGAQVPPPEPGPRVEWGGTIHLSNDDAMSLTSAQRLLWALDREAGFDVSQIRPHELLNYFTFDTTRPVAGEAFGVHASAARIDNDSLALALTVSGATPTRGPLDLTFLVDRSGSMSAEGRMDYTKRALRLAADKLVPGDRVDLVVFDHEACTPVRDFVVGRDDPALLRRMLDSLAPRGSTDLDLGLRSAYSVALGHAPEPGRAGRVMVFTDALLNTGDVNPDTVSEIGRALDARDVRLTGVGVGSEFNDDVLDKLTEKGKGAYVFLGSERVVDRLFDRGFDSLVQTIAADVRFSLTLPPSLGMEKFYGEESSRQEIDVQPVNFQAGATQVFLQELAVRDGRLADADALTFTARWQDPLSGQPRQQVFTTSIGAALRADPHDVRKGLALMRWTDVLFAHALGSDACGAPLTSYRQAIAGVQGDAEIAYTTELLGKWCDLSAPVAAWTAPAHTRIRIDADQAITEVAMSCTGGTQRRALGAAENVATFDTSPGTCDVTLYGVVPMTARVEVASTGEDMRCVVRGGRMSCG